MQITFDTTTITDDEVRGIFALLDTVRPEAFDPGPFDAEVVTRKVEEKLSEKGWVAGPSDTVATLRTESVEEAADKGWASVATLDINGLPWDERIHASSKALNADGTWRTKRGVDKALVASVEAELRGSGPKAEDAPFTVDGETGAMTFSVQPVDVPTPPAPPAPPAPEAPLAPAVIESAVSPFVALMKSVTAAQSAGKLTQPRVKELLESLDKKSIMDLRTDDKALASFAVLLTAELNGTLAEVAEACGGLKPENIKSILAILPGEGV